MKTFKAIKKYNLKVGTLLNEIEKIRPDAELFTDDSILFISLDKDPKTLCIIIDYEFVEVTYAPNHTQDQETLYRDTADAFNINVILNIIKEKL